MADCERPQHMDSTARRMLFCAMVCHGLWTLATVDFSKLHSDRRHALLVRLQAAVMVHDADA